MTEGMSKCVVSCFYYYYCASRLVVWVTNGLEEAYIGYSLEKLCVDFAGRLIVLIFRPIFRLYIFYSFIFCSVISAQFHLLV